MVPCCCSTGDLRLAVVQWFVHVFIDLHQDLFQFGQQGQRHRGERGWFVPTGRGQVGGGGGEFGTGRGGKEVFGRGELTHCFKSLKKHEG